MSVNDFVQMYTCSPALSRHSSTGLSTDDGDDSPRARDGDGDDQTANNSIIELPCSIQGKRRFELRGISFIVHEKYQLLKAIGVGAYGVVMAAVDRSTGERVALKKISGVFDDSTDAKRILREIRLMMTLNHENVSNSTFSTKSVFSLFFLKKTWIVHNCWKYLFILHKWDQLLPLCDMEAPESLDTFEDIYMVSPLFDKDLCKIIESDVELTDEHIRYFIYQILCALKYMHR